MGIMSRVVRLFKADVHGVMDQLEDKGLILKQHLREMEDEIEQKEAALNRIASDISQIESDVEKYTIELEKMEKDINAALLKDRDDLARMLIKKSAPLQRHQKELAGHLESLKSEYIRLSDVLDEHKLVVSDLTLKVKQYFDAEERKKWTVNQHKGYYSDHRDISDDQIELELFKRKEALLGGE